MPDPDYVRSFITRPHTSLVLLHCAGAQFPRFECAHDWEALQAEVNDASKHFSKPTAKVEPQPSPLWDTATFGRWFSTAIMGHAFHRPYVGRTQQSTLQP